jgi:hypothetical protein
VPDQAGPNTASAFAVVGVAALFLGLVLQGLRVPLERFVSCYFVMTVGRSSRHGSVRALALWLRAVVRWKALREYNRLVERAGERGPRRPGEDAVAFGDRRLAEFHLDRRFPNKRENVLPTKFGNRIRAWEDHARRRWSLETVVIEPHIKSLLSQQERDIREDAETDVAFAVNACLLATAAAVVVGVDRLVERPDSAWFILVCLAPLAAALGLYELAVVAAERWGELVRAGIDLHRLDFYAKLAVRQPATIVDDTVIGSAVNRMLLYGEVLPDAVRAGALAAPEPELPGVGVAAFWGRLHVRRRPSTEK